MTRLKTRIPAAVLVALTAIVLASGSALASGSLQERSRELALRADALVMDSFDRLAAAPPDRSALRRAHTEALAHATQLERAAGRLDRDAVILRAMAGAAAVVAVFFLVGAGLGRLRRTSATEARDGEWVVPHSV